MASITVDEVVLTAVGHVGDKHNVASFRESGVSIAFCLWEKFLDGGEHYAPEFTDSLLRRLAWLPAWVGGCLRGSWQWEKVPKS